MPFFQINPSELPKVWPVVAPMLQRAIDLDPSEITIEQVEHSVRTGRIYLVIWDEPEEGITGAAVVEFIDYPRVRVGHGTLMGGKGIMRPHVIQEMYNWMRTHGATKAQVLASGTLVNMYEKFGLKVTHQVMRIDL
jgi:hypothetical protein